MMKPLLIVLCGFGLIAGQAHSQTIKLSCTGQVDRYTRELNGELKPANQSLFFEKFFITPVVNKKGATTGFMLESEMTGKWVNKNTTQVLASSMGKALQPTVSSLATVRSVSNAGTADNAWILEVDGGKSVNMNDVKRIAY